MSAPFRITTRVDLEPDGKQLGRLDLPHSAHESASGALRLPIVVIKRGEGAGPTLMLTGGNHADEHEGPIALLKLARSLEKPRRPPAVDPAPQTASLIGRHAPGLIRPGDGLAVHARDLTSS